MTYYDDLKAVTQLPLPWDKLSSCNILITGASGLIGSCIIETLLENQNKDYNVYALGRNTTRMERLFQKYLYDRSFHLLTGDVTKKLEYDIPFHFIIHAASGAAPVEFAQRPVEVMMANIQGVHNLIEYGRAHELKRFLYISSGEVYGEGNGQVFTEDYSGYVDCTRSRSCYPSSKRAAETLCASYVAEYNVNVVIARPCHIYGPHFTSTDNRVYAQFLRNVMRCEDIVMKSEGLQYRSWCYVVDCVSAIFYILLKGENGQAYNIANPNSNISIRALAEIVASIGGKKVVLERPDSVEKQGFSEITKAIFSIKKIESIGWEPQVSIKDGLIKTYAELIKENDILGGKGRID